MIEFVKKLVWFRSWRRAWCWCFHPKSGKYIADSLVKLECGKCGLKYVEGRNGVIPWSQEMQEAEARFKEWHRDVKE